MWTQRDGLPSNEITEVIQGNDGYLYVSTTDGAVRFDGRNFIPVLETGGNTARQRGFVAVVESPSNGGLLVAPRSGGLLRLENGVSTTLSLPEDLAHAPIEALHVENEQTLWMGFKGGTVIRRNAAGIQRFDTHDERSGAGRVQFATDAGGTVWVARGRSLARYERGSLARVPVGTGQEILRIATAQEDGPWILADEHLCKLVNGEIQKLDKVNGSMAAYYIQAMIEDSSGRLWMGARSRGLRVWRAFSDMRRVVEVPEDITALIEDDLGNIWAGSNGGGLIRVRPGFVKPHNRTIGLLENHSPAVCEDASGLMWFANRDGGIAWLNEQGRAPVIPRPRPWDRFSAVSVSPRHAGGIWASTTYGLLTVVDQAIQGRIENPELVGPDAPAVMFTARTGDLWVALNPAGLGRLPAHDSSTLVPVEELRRTMVQAITEDPAGQVWIGCEDGLIFRQEGRRFEPMHGLVPPHVGPVQTIHFDTTGTGWIGTGRGGLVRFNAGESRSVTTRDGLPSDSITQIVSDDAGTLWIGSPAGVFHLTPGEIERYFAGAADRVHPAIIGRDAGVIEATCLDAHQPSVWKGADGLLWLATRQGVLAIDPRAERNIRSTLQTRIIHLRVDGVDRAIDHLIHIPSGSRELEIHFSPLCLSTPDNVRTRYRLTEFDDAWIDAGAASVARYVRLQPGRYRFDVASLLAGRPGSESSDSLEFEVEAAWWQTVGFRLLFAVLLAAGVAITARNVSNRRLRRRLARLEHETTLERERARIARNIHDELGAGLTRISLLTQSAHKDATEAQFDRIYQATTELTQSMDEIVWAVNPKNDDLERVAAYIGEFAQGYLADAGLTCRVLIPDVLPNRNLSAQFRHHQFLACKEALNNIVKHARATLVVIEFVIAGEILTITISDDGTGFAVTPDASSTHDGLSNMRSRMEAIGGTMTIRPGATAGTVVVLTADLSVRPRSA